MHQYSNQIERIKQKLIGVKNKDKNFKVFGANSHKYYIKNPLTENEILTFEHTYDIHFPDSYRAFLAQIGSEGNHPEECAAGPFYGIYPIVQSLNNEILKNSSINYITQPVKIYPEMDDIYWQSLIKKIITLKHPSYGEWQNHFGDIYSGILLVGTKGCLDVHGIALNGKHKDRIVNFDLELGKPVFSPEVNFLDWYERWLDDLMQS